MFGEFPPIYQPLTPYKDITGGSKIGKFIAQQRDYVAAQPHKHMIKNGIAGGGTLGQIVLTVEPGSQNYQPGNVVYPVTGMSPYTGPTGVVYPEMMYETISSVGPTSFSATIQKMPGPVTKEEPTERANGKMNNMRSVIMESPLIQERIIEDPFYGMAYDPYFEKMYLDPYGEGLYGF